MPFGGVRHSFTLAPFAFVFAGYGVEALRKTLGRCHLSANNAGRCVAAIISIIAVTIFLFSGVKLYAARESSIDLNRLGSFAKQYGVNTVVGWKDTYDILLMKNCTEGDIFRRRGIELCRYDKSVDKPYLLVGYRYRFNPPKGFKGIWGSTIPASHFKRKEIITLVENDGLLDIKTMGVQSIYYPVNGFYVYLIKPMIS
jgi:hypothetical protein